MDAGERTISSIFNDGRELYIPFFQRGYVWDEENWQHFLDSMLDISETKKRGFFGPIILKRHLLPSDREIGDGWDIIDGQQRLTTLCIFFKVLYDIHSKPEAFHRQFFNRVDEIILKHNHIDGEIFEAIVNDDLTPELQKRYTDTNNKVLAAYEFFKQPANIKLLETINPNNILNTLKFVGIDLSIDEDEQQIFDAINSLGVKLTTAELLKNHLYPSAKEESEYNNSWKKYFENDAETVDFWDTDITSGRTKRNNLDVLLQSYFIIIKEDSSKFKLENLFQEYKDYIKEHNIHTDLESRKTFIDGLTKYAGLYRKHIDNTIIDKDTEIEAKTPIQRLNVAMFGLGITTLLPYVLFILKNVDSEDERDAMLSFLETYLIRCLLGKANTKNYNNVFATLINNRIVTLSGLKEFLLNTDTDNKMPSDADIAAHIADYWKDHKTPKVILYLLELSLRNKDRHNTSLLSLNNYDLEHIMPKKWDGHWKLPESENMEELVANRRHKVGTIGNMTILKNGLNKSLHNVSWQAKKTGKNNDGLEKYAEGLETFSQYIQLPVWDESTIDERTQFILTKVLEVWKV